MAQEGWACESCGAPDSPLGYTAWMANSQQELPDILHAFKDELIAMGYANLVEIVGNFIVDETNGIVDVTSFATEDEARAAYAQIEALHDQMEGQA